MVILGKREGEGWVEERGEAKYTKYCGLEKLSSYY